MAYNFTTKGQLRETLGEYGVNNPDLLDRLMQDYDVFNSIVTIIKICDEETEGEHRLGSEFGRQCARQTAFEHICKEIKGGD